MLHTETYSIEYSRILEYRLSKYYTEYYWCIQCIQGISGFDSNCQFFLIIHILRI